MTDQGKQMKVIKDSTEEKSVMVIPRWSGMSNFTNFTIATVSKNKTKVMEAVKGSSSPKARPLIKFEMGLYQTQKHF